MKGFSIGLFTSAALVAVLAAAPAQAQDTAAAGDEASQVGNEIVVTAQKRAERLQDVPLAVTAIGGELLAAKRIEDTTSLIRAVPSLSFQQGNNPNNTSFRIRGIGTSLFGVGFEPSVSVVVDGVVSARAAQAFSDLNDIERIEVLRGPQGTLFGKNATAGVINVVTARPSKTFTGKAEFSIAEKDEYRAKASISGPLSDTLRTRVTGYYNHVGGYLNEVTLGGKAGGNEGYGVRGKLEWDAASNLNFLLTADYRKSNADCCRSIAYSFQNPVLAKLYAPVVASPDNRSLREDLKSFSNTRQSTVSLQGDLDLGAATLTSITGYQYFYVTNNFDADGIDSPLYVGATGGNNYSVWDINGGTNHQYNLTQELRIASNGHDRLSYVGGLYFTDFIVSRQFARRRGYCAAGTAAQIGTTCTPTSYQSQEYFARLHNQAISAFAQLEYEIVPRLKVIGGLRYQWEWVQAWGFRSGGPMPQYPTDTVWPLGTAINGWVAAHNSAPSGKAGLQYQFSRDAQAYFTYSHGYKSIGLGTEVTTDFVNQQAVRPETVNSFEVGFKGSMFDHKLSLNLAAFYSKYNDLQIQVTTQDLATGTFAARTTNAGGSVSKGIEAELNFTPDEHLSLGLSASYVDATVDVNGFTCPTPLSNASVPATIYTNTAAAPTNACYRLNSATNFLINLKGSPLPSTPKWRVSFSPGYEHGIGAGLVGFVNADVSYQSSQYLGQADPTLILPAYTLVNASVGVKTEDNKYSLRVFVRNLFDKGYVQDLSHEAIAQVLGSTDIWAQIPKDADRYFGATIGVKF